MCLGLLPAFNLLTTISTCLMVFILLEKIFFNGIGILLTNFSKKNFSLSVFEKYCSNLFIAIFGVVVKISGTGSGKVVFLVAAGVATGQDAVDRIKVVQHLKYQFKKWLNVCIHLLIKLLNLKMIDLLRQTLQVNWRNLVNFNERVCRKRYRGSNYGNMLWKSIDGQ